MTDISKGDKPDPIAVSGAHKVQMEYKNIDGMIFIDMVSVGAKVLGQHREEINDLNVFPIPDGDTGDNMLMTIESGLKHVSRDETADLSEASKKLSDGMLFGARGNSGVILSRIFYGIAKGLVGRDSADVAAICDALISGVSEAYSAVSRPVEGTILSVYRDAAEHARSSSSEEDSVDRLFDEILTEMRASLERTPELLAVLKEAGVVDSGGAGLMYIFEGMRRALSGETGDDRVSHPGPGDKAEVDLSLFGEDSELEFGYCTEFLLRIQRAKADKNTFDVDRFTGEISRFGDSIVAFRDDSILKVHIHTRAPGDVLNFCQRYGEFLTLKIENMTLQHNGTKKEEATPSPKKPKKKYGIVAVAGGKGIVDTFVSLGCDKVIEGGQSMNPEVDDFIRAFREIPADNVIVYPNNKNVILAARQAAELYGDANVMIVPSKTVGEGYSGISMLDTSSDDPETIIAEQTEIISAVVTGFVSKASRDAQMDGVRVVAGDYVGFSDGKIIVDDPQRMNALIQLASNLSADKCDVMLLIYGKETDKEEAEAVADALGRRFRRTEVVTIDGGQPVHDYIIVLE